jgi:hypothetical protein
MQVKNKPCMIYTVMRLIPWKQSHRSETHRQRILTCYVKFCHFSSKMLLFKANFMILITLKYLVCCRI